ncbi:hypothetical protein D1007_08430 [Hordeum vulgare]|nr:hypothetical protein D1007_08430 [Hordeum vulgare]
MSQLQPSQRRKKNWRPSVPIREKTASSGGQPGSITSTGVSWDWNGSTVLKARATYHPSPPPPIAVLDTRRRKQAREHLLATMDPVLKAYLDKMSEDAAARAKKQDSDTNAILQAVATHTARIDALVTWKPELEARFVQLELSVAALQAASPPTTTSNGSPPPVPSPAVAREIHGQPGHGASLHTREPTSVTPASPAAPPSDSRVEPNKAAWPCADRDDESEPFGTCTTGASELLEEADYQRDPDSTRVHGINHSNEQE